MTVTLVTGATAHARESAIAAQLPSPHQNGADPHGPEHGAAPTAVILEGLADAGSPLFPSASVLISRIAPGCLCCTGNLVLRVTLNRFLRQRPERLFIGVARSEHLDQLRSWLQSAPYDQLLELAPVLAS
ncbi:MAG: GTPase [Massilia sp.]